MGLSDFASTPGIGIGFTPKSIGNPFRRLKKKLKKEIKPYDLKIVNSPKTANYKVILIADFDNEDGYDCFGYKCYPKSKSNKFPEIKSISYSGVCGDVNTINLTDKNSQILFLSKKKTNKQT